MIVAALTVGAFFAFVGFGEDHESGAGVGDVSKPIDGAHISPNYSALVDPGERESIPPIGGSDSDTESEEKGSDPDRSYQDVLDWIDSEIVKDVEDINISALVWQPNWVLDVLTEELTLEMQQKVIDYRSQHPEFFREKFRMEGLEECLALLRDHSEVSTIAERARLGFALHSTLDSAIYLDLLHSGGRVHEITDDPGEFDNFYDRSTYDFKTRVLFELQHSVMFYRTEEVPYHRQAGRYITSRKSLHPSDKPKMQSRFDNFIALPPLTEIFKRACSLCTNT